MGPLGRVRILALACAALAASCTRPATQLVVVVSSDIAALDAVHVTVAPTDAMPGHVPSDATFELGSAHVLPLSFGVTPPGGEARRRVEIVVEGRGPGASVTRRVRTGFLEGQSLALPVFLADSCRGVECSGMGPDYSCDRGVCVVVDVAPESLVPVQPGQELADASVPADASLADAGPRSDAGGGCATLTELPSTGAIPVGLAAFPDVPRALVAFHDGANAVSYFVEAGGGANPDPIVVTPGEFSVGDTAAVALAGGTDGVVAFSRSDVGAIDVFSVALGASSGIMLGRLSAHRLRSGAGARWRDGAVFATESMADGSMGLWVSVAGGTMVPTVSGLPGEPADVALTNAGTDLVMAFGAHGATTECSVSVWDTGGSAPTFATVPTGGSICSRVAVASLGARDLAVGWSDQTAPAGVDAMHVTTVRLDAAGALTVLAPPAVLPGSIDGRPLVLSMGGALVIGRRTTSGLAFSRGTALGTSRELPFAAIAPLPGDERGAGLGDRIVVLGGFAALGDVVVAEPCLP